MSTIGRFMRRFMYRFRHMFRWRYRHRKGIHARMKVSEVKPEVEQ